MPELIRNHGILVLGTGEWALSPREPDLLAVLADAGNRVLCIDCSGLRAPRLHVHDLGRIVSRLKRLGRGMRSPYPGIVLSTAFTIPLPGSRFVRRINAWLQHRAVRRATAKLGHRSTIVWVAGPIFGELVSRLRAPFVLYDCYDEFSAFPDVDGELMGELERKSIRHADLVIAASTELVAAKRGQAETVRLLRNGVHIGAYTGELPPEPAPLAAVPHPRLGYVGNIYGRLDLEALDALALAHPDWAIVLIGFVRSPIGRLAFRPNVHVLGHQPRETMPAFVRHLDVGLVPHVPGPLADRQDPTKIYEYLAAGLPVVCTDLSAIAPFGSWVRRVPFGGDWVGAIAAELAADGPEQRAARHAEARQHSWEARARELSAWIDEALAAKQPPRA